MARRLRLHFATRRSNTDPLSETCSQGAEDGSPAQAPAPLTSFHMKVTPGQLALALPPLSPDYGSLQRHTTVFVPKVNSGSGSKKSMLQISLQPCGRKNGDADSSDGVAEEADPAIGDGGAGGSSDAGSCSSSTASDVGYCSSNSIFEPDVPERKAPNDRAPRRKARAPLRRCSSLVIFPRSPCTTPPASPISPVAPSLVPSLPPSIRGPFQTSHQLQLSAATDAAQDEPKASVATAVNGLRLSKSSGSTPEFRDARPILHFSVPVDSAATSERTDKHSNVLVPCANQPPLPPGRGSASRTMANADNPKPWDKSEESASKVGSRNAKLFRSTSACLLPTGKASAEKRHHTCPIICPKSDVPQESASHQGLQRSVSLEVPCGSSEISCHMFNTKQLGSLNGTAHVHIHVSRGSAAKESPRNARASDKRNLTCPEGIVVVSVLVFHSGL